MCDRQLTFIIFPNYPRLLPFFRMTEFGTELNRFMERCYVESRAIDVESLCIVAGEKV